MCRSVGVWECVGVGGVTTESACPASYNPRAGLCGESRVGVGWSGGRVGVVAEGLLGANQVGIQRLDACLDIGGPCTCMS